MSEMSVTTALKVADSGITMAGYVLKDACSVLSAEVRRLQSAATKEDARHEQTCKERDAAEEALSRAYVLIVGQSPEWSNNFGHQHALKEIQKTIGELQDENERMRAEAGHIIDETGTKRRVLGTLLLTGDGCVIGHKCELWYALPVGAATEIVSMDHQNYIQPHQPAYSTRAAAIRARWNQ